MSERTVVGDLRIQLEKLSFCIQALEDLTRYVNQGIRKEKIDGYIADAQTALAVMRAAVCALEASK